jgi:hypothetical protein
MNNQDRLALASLIFVMIYGQALLHLCSTNHVYASTMIWATLIVGPGRTASPQPVLHILAGALC